MHFKELKIVEDYFFSTMQLLLIATERYMESAKYLESNKYP